jgi:hypothetical protein
MAPSIIFLKIHSGKRFKIKLWLPIFLLWPIAIILLLIAIPFLLLAEMIFAQRGTPIHFFGLLFGFISVLSSLRGTKIKVAKPAKRVTIFITIH